MNALLDSMPEDLPHLTSSSKREKPRFLKP